MDATVAADAAETAAATGTESPLPNAISTSETTSAHNPEMMQIARSCVGLIMNLHLGMTTPDSDRPAAVSRGDPGIPIRLP